MIKRGDYILITDYTKDTYLQIGEVIDVKYYPDGDVQLYIVRFSNRLCEYDYHLEYDCEVLMFERN